MSQTQIQQKEYRITLTDIRGVGPKTAEKIRSRLSDYRDEGESWISPMHLFANGGPAERDLRDQGVGRDTLKHLRNVGRAVKGTGRSTVEAKHLSGNITDQAEFSSSFIRIDIPQEESDESEDPDIPQYDTETLQSALDTIHSEYGEGYGGQVSFEGDMAGFFYESERYNGEDHQLPQGIVQSVMRYRHKADRVEKQGDFEDIHKAVLVDFADSL